jgi:hypothetical protein
VKRNRRIKDGITVLPGDNASGSKAFAVANGVNFVNNFFIGVARSQEIRVHGVGHSRGFHRAYCRIQCLRQYLASEYARRAFGTVATEQVGLYLLDFKKPE